MGFITMKVLLKEVYNKMTKHCGRKGRMERFNGWMEGTEWTNKYGWNGRNGWMEMEMEWNGMEWNGMELKSLKMLAKTKNCKTKWDEV